MTRNTLVSILLFFSVFAASANNIRFTAASQKVVSQGERFKVSFSVNAKASSFKGPNFKGLSVLSGPNQSSSSSIQIVNGNMSQEVTTTYSYIVVGNSPGSFTIDPGTCVVDGKNYTSNTLKIEVVKSSQKTQQQSNGRSQSQQRTSTNISDEDVFVRVTVDKRKVYLGQPIVATLKVYTRMSLADFKDYKFPSFKGFYSQAIKEPDRISMERENVNGQIYETGLFKQVLLYPQRSGKLVIDPFELECVLRVRVQRQSFFDPGYREVSKKVASKAVTITVTDLPKPAPDTYNGAVGDFSFDVSVDKTELKANDAFTLKAKISGSGNLKLIDQLGIEFPSDFEVYDPKINNAFKNSTSGTRGSKTFEYLIIPRHSGTFEIPSLAFAYFDPGQKRYKTLRSKPITITVEKGDGTQATAMVQGISKEQVKYLGKDIRYLKQLPYELQEKGYFFFGSGLYYLLLVIPALIFAVLVFAWRKQIADSKDIAKTKNRRASKLTKKRLKTASQHLQSEKDSEFFEELVRALWGYLSDKLSIPLAELSKDSARAELQTYKVPDELITELTEVLDTCEFARYAPSAANKSKEELLKQAESLLNKLESAITKKA